jgi:hypothetical protein
MTYLDRVAQDIRNEVPPALLPAGDVDLLFRIYAVLALALGDRVTAEDVHNAWSAWALETQGRHESVRPFYELDESTQAQDDPYVAAIRKVARTHRPTIAVHQLRR